jgi:RNA polymerase sigma-70 factor (ECF subfamily)
MSVADLSADDVEERDAIRLVRQGEADAYGYLVEKYSRRALSIAWGIVRDGAEAEEVVQEAFVRGYETIGRFREGERFGPWLFRIVTNLGLDSLRRRRRISEPLSEAEPAPRLDGADVATFSNEIARRIDAALLTLPEMQQLVARLHLVEELDHRDVAAITGLTEGTIRSHLSHARRKLQEMLQDLRMEES